MRRAGVAFELAVLGCFFLLFTPHTAIIRAQMMDMAGAAGAGGGGGVLGAINAAGGDISSVVDQFRAQRDAAQAVVGNAQEAADAATARVPDLVRTGINETQVAEFYAQFAQNFGSGANLQAIQDIWASSNIKQLSDQARTVRDTLLSAAQLGIAAITAGPFAVIGLIVIGLGLASAITSLLGGILYAAASAVGLYVTLAGITSSECEAAATPEEDKEEDKDKEKHYYEKDKEHPKEDDKYHEDKYKKPPSPPDAPSAPVYKPKKPSKPRVNCFEKQKQVAWVASIMSQAEEANKYLMPLMYNGAAEGLVSVSEGVLRAAVTVAKRLQAAPDN
ncbi:hypothetical protein GPECTOR_30g213 [Gonium pectorale]|uniref:Uncharacterized protein n=1 Tax=Gonium pectorale TaxID=33097 RepID=A0A150GE45_GONPE|nr:hypothetical protein GPECTOR_30g213 [Gonium pectorale]|eukprot:KXZ48117.1 hypothetical protein GPECTOR_30g213 [Gonium pectorale]